MAFKDEYDFELVVNEMKNIVIGELERQLQTEEYSNICQCQDCVLDIVAFALNHLKPAYRSTLSYKGAIYKQNLHTERNEQAFEKVVRDAIEKIKKNPSH